MVFASALCASVGVVILIYFYGIKKYEELILKEVQMGNQLRNNNY